MPREFLVRQDRVAYQTVTWKVDADSFEEAVDLVCEGYGYEYDVDEYDYHNEDIGTVECAQCCAEEADDCDCDESTALQRSHEFLAEIGL